MTDREHKCKNKHRFCTVIFDKEANEWRIEINHCINGKTTKYIEFITHFCPFCGTALSEWAKAKVRKQGRPGVK